RACPRGAARAESSTAARHRTAGCARCARYDRDPARADAPAEGRGMTATTGRAPAPGAPAILARAGLVAAGGDAGSTVRAVVGPAAPLPPGGFRWAPFGI